jgi:hypothetical protein
MRAMIEGTSSAIDLVPDGGTARHGGCVLRRSTAATEPVGPAGLPAWSDVARATEARSVLDRLQAEYDHEFTLQQGLLHYVDAALLLSSDRVPHSAPESRVFAEHLDRQIHAIIIETGADMVLFQIESPHALMDCVHQALGTTHGPDGVPIAETVAEVINRATPQARFGVHLCVGDRRGEAMVGRLHTTAPIVAAVEAIGDALERPEALEYVHFPLATGTAPPSLEPLVYRPLGRLRAVLPDDTRIVAGFAHEQQPLGVQVQVRDLIEEAVGEPIDIATACGLGRHTPEVAAGLVCKMVELASG